MELKTTAIQLYNYVLWNRNIAIETAYFQIKLKQMYTDETGHELIYTHAIPDCLFI